jgi:hypothetical protein
LGEEKSSTFSRFGKKLGDIAANTGYLDEAIARYQTAIKIKSGNYLTYHKLGKKFTKKRTV